MKAAGDGSNPLTIMLGCDAIALGWSFIWAPIAIALSH
jgi:hypothetical protein